MTEQNQTESIRQAVGARVKAESEKIPKNGSTDTPDVSIKFIRQCLESNELGDGCLFDAVNRGRFLYDTTAGTWYNWNGTFFEPDQAGGPAAAMENTVKAYARYSSYLFQQKSDSSISKDDKSRLEVQIQRVDRRINRLRSRRGCENALHWCHTYENNSISLPGEQLDQNPWLLACPNEVIDLRTGKGRPGKQTDLLSRASNVCPDEKAPSHQWVATLNQIFSGDPDLIDFVQKVLGYAITGLNTESILPIFCGQGRNGKTLIIETLCHVLGRLARPIQSDLLMDPGRFRRSSAAPSPDIMALKGLRLAFASESDQDRRISPSRTKWLTGGDMLVGRNPHDRFDSQFRPTHTLILSTNDRPQAPSQDFAFWERVRLINFRVSFVDREPAADNERRADKRLLHRLKVEAPGILAWLIRGCLRWQEEGLNPPHSVLDATRNYQRDEDLLLDFLEECCFLDHHAEVAASSLYDEFSVWFERNISKKVLSQKKFGRMLSKRFNKQKTSGGRYFYFGLGLLSKNPSNP